jgi:hypothetical protein
MIEVANNKIKCELGPDDERTQEQILLYQQVVEQMKKANELFLEYKNKYATDKRAIERLLKLFNGG